MPFELSDQPHPKTIVINYTHSLINSYRHEIFSHLRPRVDYLKIPEFPVIVLSGVQGEVLLKVKTDGQKVISVEVIESAHPVLQELSIENVKTWRFNEHTPTEFTVHWKYALGEPDGNIKPDIATLNLPRSVEIVMFPRSNTGNSISDCELTEPDGRCSNNLPEVEYIKIPEHPRQLLGAGIKGDVILKVRTDGQKVVSADGEFPNKVYRDFSIETIKAWRFKEHDPTEFTAHWNYVNEVDDSFAPETVTFSSPDRVEIKTIQVPERDPVTILPKKKVRMKK
jgi:hypothetical protein